MNLTMAKPSTENQVERRAATTWVGIVVGLLALQILMCAVAIWLAVTDESMAIVPDYHTRALAWDQQRALESASLALGWQVAVSVDPNRDVLGRRQVAVQLFDRDQKPLDEASVELTMFHHARAKDVFRAQMEPTGAGIYKTELRLKRSGLWEIRLRVQRGEDEFVWRQEQQFQFSNSLTSPTAKP